VRVLVCGGRDFTNERAVFGALDELNAQRGPITCVIHGDAKGADELANAWAVARGVEWHMFKARWETHGRAAGPIRNRDMLHVGAPDVVVAFHGGSGTRDMVSQARGAGVEVLAVGRSTA
jgi:hypothetical protein